jgi:hypothetical protein
LPFSGHYCGDHHSSECECVRIRADHPVTPEMVEIVEVSQTHGSDAAAHRSKQLMRNSERRRINRDRKRYAAVAMEKNLSLAANCLAERKLAEQSLASASNVPPPKELTLSEQFDALAAREAAAKKLLTPTAAHGCPTPASFAGVGVSSPSGKKPPASAEVGEPVATKEAITA